MGARVIQVIEADDRRGIGVEGDPFRRVIQFYSLEGELLWERDEWQEAEARKRQATPSVSAASHE